MALITPKELENIGLSLYGWGWQTKIAEYLGVSPRTIRRYMAGQPIPLAVSLAVRSANVRFKDE